MGRRRFNGAADLSMLQAIVAERTSAMGPCTNLHPGDIAHRIYSGLRGRDIPALVPVWEDRGSIVGFGIVWPQDHSFDVVVAHGTDRDIAVAIVGEIVEMAEADGPVSTDVIGDDLFLAGVLAEHGFVAGPADYVFTESALESPIPPLDVGYEVRSVTLTDAPQLAAVHAGAFGSHWTPAGYATMMAMPGYEPRDEIVAVDADGTFMGFAVVWYDGVNRVGHFEPVGVHRGFQRRGVGTVLLTEGKRRMSEAGMATATVWHSRTDPGASAFYRSNGFEPRALVTRWING